MEAAGISQTSETPSLSNRGRGVLIGFIDTGIDYQNPLFQNPDGTSRILGIWDQTIDSEKEDLERTKSLIMRDGEGSKTMILSKKLKIDGKYEEVRMYEKYKRWTKISIKKNFQEEDREC